MPKKSISPVQSAASMHRTTPISGTLTPVPNYPTKLTIYQLAASKYWWVRYYAGGKIFRRSTKCTTKPDAFTFAKKFYDDINFKTHQGLLRGKEDNFEVCARAVIAQQE